MTNMWKHEQWKLNLDWFLIFSSMNLIVAIAKINSKLAFNTPKMNKWRLLYRTSSFVYYLLCFIYILPFFNVKRYIVDHCLFFSHISFGPFVVCPSIYGFSLPLRYFQTFLLTCDICFLNKLRTYKMRLYTI